MQVDPLNPRGGKICACSMCQCNCARTWHDGDQQEISILRALADNNKASANSNDGTAVWGGVMAGALRAGMTAIGSASSSSSSSARSSPLDQGMEAASLHLLRGGALPVAAIVAGRKMVPALSRGVNNGEGTFFPGASRNNNSRCYTNRLDAGGAGGGAAAAAGADASTHFGVGAAVNEPTCSRSDCPGDCCPTCSLSACSFDSPRGYEVHVASHYNATPSGSPCHEEWVDITESPPGPGHTSSSSAPANSSSSSSSSSSASSSFQESDRSVLKTPPPFQESAAGPMPISSAEAFGFLKRKVLPVVAETLKKKTALEKDEQKRRYKNAKVKVDPLAAHVINFDDLPKQKSAMEAAVAAHDALQAGDIPAMLSALGCEEEGDGMVISQPDPFA